ncbi:hypothetical protein Btru_000280, partial [Bulinus truncatus]
VTLVSGYAPMADTARSLLSPKKKIGFRFVPKSMPLPPEYTTELDPGLLGDQPGRGRLPKLNTTMTFENHVRIGLRGWKLVFLPQVPQFRQLPLAPCTATVAPCTATVAISAVYSYSCPVYSYSCPVYSYNCH